MNEWLEKKKIIFYMTTFYQELLTFFKKKKGWKYQFLKIAIHIKPGISQGETAITEALALRFTVRRGLRWMYHVKDGEKERSGQSSQEIN